jgi:predicted nuclease of restriction endonuclease-like (RecB) superfamily
MILNEDKYLKYLNNIKSKIKAAQLEAHFKVNETLLNLYFDIGRLILKAQETEGWGAQVIDFIARDIKKDQKSNKGFSVRNLKYMRSFALSYPQFPIVQVPLAQNSDEFMQVSLAQITWYHHITLISKIKDLKERIFYIQETANNGWSRNVMVLQIKNDLYNRKGKALNNFNKTLPLYQSDLAKEIFKDPYHFDFLVLKDKMKEIEIENQLIDKISDFLMELGRGFAFVGKQFSIQVDNSAYRIDLLFYHTKMHAYVVIELKAGEFKPEYISKLNFYISAVDDLLKSGPDNPTVGLLLCADKSDIKVEYAMRGLEKPLGVATYELKKLIKDNIEQLRQDFDD